MRKPHIINDFGVLYVSKPIAMGLTYSELTLWQKALEYVYERRVLRGRFVPAMEMMK
jgi:hypothetical protein